jgi:hypothetical protein
MSTMTRIHKEIDALSVERAELWHRMAGGRDLETMEEIKRLDSRLQALWEAHRAERARIRFGERDDIVKRARAEERLERAA